MAEKQPEGPTTSDDYTIEGDRSSVEAPKDDVGNLTFNQYTEGGLGRHLGVFSTASLM